MLPDAGEPAEHRDVRALDDAGMDRGVDGDEQREQSSGAGRREARALRGMDSGYPTLTAGSRTGSRSGGGVS